MNPVAGLYYDGSTARAIPVELTADGAELHIRGRDGAELDEYSAARQRAA